MGDYSKLGHPTNDPELDKDAQEYVRKMMHTLIDLFKVSEQSFGNMFIDLETPAEVVQKCCIHATKHRTAMLTAHYLAWVGVEDEEAESLVRELAEDIVSLTMKQYPQSRKTIEGGKGEIQ